MVLDAGSEFSVTLSLDQPADAYYLGTAFQYDANRLQFLEVLPVGWAAGGIHASGALSGGLYGASVSRTTPLVSPEGGAAMELRFQVREWADPGETEISFQSLELSDSEAGEMDATLPDPVAVSITESVASLRLTTPGLLETVEGAPVEFTAAVAVTGLTTTLEEASPRIDLSFALHSGTEDPSLWPEAAWQSGEFYDALDGEHHYRLWFDEGSSVGEYSIGVRTSLDDGPWFYGGWSPDGGGFWDGVEFISPTLSVEPVPPWIHTAAEWNFDGESLLPDRAIFTNRMEPVQVAGAQFNDFITGASGRAANARGWVHDPAEPAGWVVGFSTESLENLTLSSRQSGSGTGPGHFTLMASLDSLDWEPVDGGSLILDSGWTSGSLSDLPLPPLYNNRERIWLRWTLANDITINGSAGLSSSGTSRLDEVSIQGTRMNPVRVDVWPGDADHNGVVDEEDVLALGAWWGAHGPVPLQAGVEWAPREVEEWLPPMASYADTEGMGVVDHRGLRAIGLHFGQSRPGMRAVPVADPVATLPLSAGTGEQEADEWVLLANGPETISGISFRLNLRDPALSEMIHIEILPGSWATENGDGEPDLLPAESSASESEMAGSPPTGTGHLSFLRADPSTGEIAGAFSLPGRTSLTPSEELLRIRVQPESGWTGGTELILNRLSILSEPGTGSPKRQLPGEVRWVHTSQYEPSLPPAPPPNLPEETLLHPAFPNPFRDNATIRFDLAEPEEVRLELFSTNGRRVLKLLSEHREAGTYEIPLLSGPLSSGLYLLRLQAGRFSQTRSLIHIQ